MDTIERDPRPDPATATEAGCRHARHPRPCRAPGQGTQPRRLPDRRRRRPPLREPVLVGDRRIHPRPGDPRHRFQFSRRRAGPERRQHGDHAGERLASASERRRTDPARAGGSRTGGARSPARCQPGPPGDRELRHRLPGGLPDADAGARPASRAGRRDRPVARLQPLGDGPAPVGRRPDQVAALSALQRSPGLRGDRRALQRHQGGGRLHGDLGALQAGAP